MDYGKATRSASSVEWGDSGQLPGTIDGKGKDAGRGSAGGKEQRTRGIYRQTQGVGRCGEGAAADGAEGSRRTINRESGNVIAAEIGGKEKFPRRIHENRCRLLANHIGCGNGSQRSRRVEAVPGNKIQRSGRPSEGHIEKIRLGIYGEIAGASR